MTKEELAEILDERPIGHEVTKEEEKLAAENQLVVIYGASDDLCEMRGAIDDEFDCFGGGDIDCKELPGTLTAIWGEGDADWTYETNLPHAKFRVYDDDDDGSLYCVGIVIDLKMNRFEHRGYVLIQQSAPNNDGGFDVHIESEDSPFSLDFSSDTLVDEEKAKGLIDDFIKFVQINPLTRALSELTFDDDYNND
ncbi:MAG: hypothetical protein K6F27_08110 [Ruminococcus sp.]|nr:hypothetical protein [Ruminococcus sp.]